MGLRQPPNHAANWSSTHKHSVRELPASKRCSSDFGRSVRTRNLNIDYKSRLGPKMDRLYSIDLSIFLHSDDSGSKIKGTGPREEA
jgi:hypothetical protein